MTVYGASWQPTVKDEATTKPFLSELRRTRLLAALVKFGTDMNYATEVAYLKDDPDVVDTSMLYLIGEIGRRSELAAQTKDASLKRAMEQAVLMYQLILQTYIEEMDDRTTVRELAGQREAKPLRLNGHR